MLQRKNKIAGYVGEGVLYVDFTLWIKFRKKKRKENLFSNPF